MNHIKRTYVQLLLASITLFNCWPANAQQLGLQQAVNRALQDDDWLLASEQRESAMREDAVAAAQLPDPKMNLSIANLPLDTLNLSQEAMTQVRVGVSQMFPRGDILELSQQQKLQLSEMSPYQRDDRKAKVKLEVTHLWLATYQSQQTIALTNENRDLFEQLVELTDLRYRNAAGISRQQDLLRAQLELSRLDDRIAGLQQTGDASRQLLSQWLPYDWVSQPLPAILPEQSTGHPAIDSLSAAATQFAHHPAVLALDKQVQAANTSVELARQSLKPEFMVGANYSFRDASPLGIDRADFISLEVSFDLPFFTANRQNRKVAAASYNASAALTDRTLLFKSMYANYQQAFVQLQTIEIRQAWFTENLLPQTLVVRESALAAYTADTGTFEEVIRAYIAELDTRIQLLALNVEARKFQARLDYLFTNSTGEETLP